MGVVVTVLGPVGIVRDGLLVDPGPRQRRLLAGLAVASGDTVPSDKLVDIIWGAEPPASASRSLKTYVTRLRQSLTAEALASEVERGDPIPFRSEGYRLDPTLVDIDADQFEHDVDEADRRLRIGDDDEALACAQRAIDAWSGAAFGDLADEDWARPTAVRLEERRLEAQAILVRALIASGFTSRAVGEARALVDAEPHREGPAEALMLALHADGRTAEALRVVPDLRKRLATSVGLEPSAGLVEVERRIAVGAVARRPLGRIMRGYELHERVGEGAHALVHRATQTVLDREVAIKIIRPDLADRPDFIRRFEYEAHLVAHVEHPHVVPLHDFWREPGAAYLVMRYMTGGSVADLLGRNGGLSTARVATLVEQIGAALASAHQRGVVHRDIRPANLLLDDEGSGFLADFGIAHLVGDGDPLPVLSLAHAAPEVLRGAAAERPADIHAFGVTVYEMLIGQSPFSDTSDRAELIRRHLREPLPAVRQLRPELSPALDAVLARATAKDPVERPGRVEQLVAELLEALDRSDRAHASSADRALVAAANSEPVPYVGLRRFEEADADWFFGRDDATSDVIEALRRQPFVTVAGPSGSGKSSIVRAGVLPRIRRGALAGSDTWFVSTMVPGEAPFEALEAALLRVAVNPPASLSDAMAEPRGVSRMIRRCLPTDDAVLLLVVDQFEELFTMGSRATSLDFVDQLCAAVSGSDRLRVITTIRADHLDEPLEIQALAEVLRNGLVTAGPMSTEGLERAITEPAHRAGAVVEAGLAAELVAESIDRPSALPLLQYTLTQLWERRVSGVMTMESYRRLGGLGAAIGDRAESLVPTDADRAAARRIFARLVTVPDIGEATRRRALRTEFGDEASTLACLDAFGSARLLSFDHDAANHEPIVEVAHEALLTSWDRLADWIDDDREDLGLLRRVTEASRTWETGGRDSGDLARGVFLGRTRDLIRRRPELASDTEHAWFGASDEADRRARATEAEAVARQARLNTRLRRLLALAAGLLVLALAASAIAVTQRSNAIETAEAADLDRLVAQSAAELTEAPDRAMLLALEAHRRRSDSSTQGAVLDAIANEPALVGLLPPILDGASELVVSSDGRTAFAWAIDPGDGRWTLFDADDGSAVEGSTIENNGIRTAVISGDGTTTLLASNDGTLIASDTSGRREIPWGEPVFSLSIDHRGETALLLNDNVATVLDLASGTERWRYEADANELVCGCSSIADDGGTVAVVVSDTDSPNLEEAAIVFLDSEGTEQRRTDDHPAVLRTAFFRNGTQLISGGSDGRLVVHDVWGEQPTIAVTVGATPVLAVGGNDAGAIAVAGLDGQLTTWDAELRLISTHVLPGVPHSLVVSDNNTVTAVLTGASAVRLDPARTTLGVDTRQAAFSHVPRTGTYFDVASEDFTEAIIHRLDTGDVVTRVGFDGAIDSFGRYADWSTDGEWLYTYDRAAELLAIAEIFGETRHVLSLDTMSNTLRGVGYSKESNAATRLGDDGKTFLLVGEPGNAAAGWFDPATGELLAGPLYVDAISAALILADESVVIGGPNPLMVLPPELDTEPIVLLAETGMIPLAEHPDGQVLAGGRSGRVVLIDPVSGSVTELVGAEGAVEGGTFDPDGDRAVILYGESMALFDLETDAMIGRPISVERSASSIPDMSWTADGKSVWYDSASGPTRIDLDPEAWVERACSIAGRSLTDAEWQTFVSPDSDPIDACAEFGG